jgi:hypothetical protein
MQKLIVAIAILLTVNLFAQNKTRAITLDEYQKAKTFTVKDLDNDTYIKFENKYILDRYENRKPYFITGDDGLKKRMDIYRLIAKDSLQEIGIVIFYTNEKGKTYQACLPGLSAAPFIWEAYFADIHSIEKEEKNFVLKLSYVLSKELSYQVYKSLNSNKDISREHGTYGNEICFPGNMQVTMSNGSTKDLSSIQPGDLIVTINPFTKQTENVRVQSLSVHEAKNYAITHLQLTRATANRMDDQTEILLSTREINATPNHPVLTANGEKKAGEIKEGDELLCYNNTANAYLPYTVWQTEESPAGIQKVYNINTDSKTLMLNGVMMLQKSLNLNKPENQ